MKTVVRILVLTAAFTLVVAAVYWFLSYEQTGSLLLVFMILAAVFMAAYLVLVARGPRRAEDDPGGTHDGAAGTALGRFQAGSLWPVVMAIGAGTALQGLIYGIWLLAPGILLLVWAMIGLMAESRE